MFLRYARPRHMALDIRKLYRSRHTDQSIKSAISSAIRQTRCFWDGMIPVPLMVPRARPSTLPTCPKCASAEARWLEFTSDINGFDAYQCITCRTVWVADGPTALARMMWPPRTRTVTEIDHPRRRRGDNVVHMPTVERTGSPAPSLPDAAVARRAYELYEQRGSKHGFGVEDWLTAERELQAAVRLTAA
jgi:hypothetical protein